MGNMGPFGNMIHQEENEYMYIIHAQMILESKCILTEISIVLSLSYYNVFSFLVFLDKFVLHDIIAFWQKGGKNRTDCVFLDKFIFHDLIAFFRNGREESDSFVI